MPERRLNEVHEVAVEYALFLAHTRGVSAGIAYLDSCAIPHGIFWRVLHSAAERRKRERRRSPRGLHPA